MTMRKAEEPPIRILTKDAQQTVRKAVTLINFVMSGATKYVDLISGGFKKYKKCSRVFQDLTET